MNKPVNKYSKASVTGFVLSEVEAVFMVSE